MRPEYDLTKLTGRVRGKCVGSYPYGTNRIRLELHVQAAFPGSEAVNEALRLLIKVAHQHTRKSSLTRSKLTR